MALYLDTAELEAIERIHGIFPLAGVTTNPTILHRAGKSRADIEHTYARLMALGIPVVFFQTKGVDTPAMVEEGKRLRALGDNVIVKVPCTAAGIAATAQLAEAGVPVLLTAVYHAAQCLIARDLRIWGIAPYIGRMDDLRGDGVDQAARMRDILPADVHILAASLRSVDKLGDLAAVGITDYTMGPALFDALADFDLSVDALAAFEADDAASAAGI